FSDLSEIAILSGAGSGLGTSLLTKSKPIDIAKGMEFLLGEKLDVTHVAMVLFQSYFDRSDTMAFMPLMVKRPPSGVRSKHIYQSYGSGDSYATPPTLVNTAAGIGLPVVSPLEMVDLPTTTRPVSLNLTGGDGKKRTGAMLQYIPAGYDGHFVALMDDG